VILSHAQGSEVCRGFQQKQKQKQQKYLKLQPLFHIASLAPSNNPTMPSRIVGQMGCTLQGIDSTITCSAIEIWSIYGSGNGSIWPSAKG
jgi:hypothetical protein